MRHLHPFLLCASLALPALPLFAQQSSSSSSSGKDSTRQESTSSPRVRAGQPEAGGSAITLETNEALFDLAAALNACGYDADLANSDPVRGRIRADIDTEVAASSTAQAAQRALCGYIAQHGAVGPGRELAQYVSLALYLSPPPALEPIADQTEMPPDALQVISILPLLRSFAAAAHLHAIWLAHRAEYDAITARVHDPITRMILATNVYLKVPVSSYDGRRLLILVEPLLAPNAPNARIYSTDYVLVTSPDTTGQVRLDQIRHLYLHYEIEPLVYARAASMSRLVPLLKPVQEAPLDFIYKSDVVALVTECLIKAIEARTMDPGQPTPRKPAASAPRTEQIRYEDQLTEWERAAETARRRAVDLDMRQGWTLTAYFYEQLQVQERSPESLSEAMGQMVYGMDVGRERHRDEQIQFLPEGSGELVRRAPRVPTGMMLAEKKLLEGDLDGAEAIADKSIEDAHATPSEHTGAHYVKARVALMEGDPKTSSDEFATVLRDSSDPRTQAWSHIYLGRLYDIQVPSARTQALAEYHAALAVPGLEPDARSAAETGLKTPFVVPTTTHRQEEELDPSGKAEKEAYKPDEPDAEPAPAAAPNPKPAPPRG